MIPKTQATLQTTWQQELANIVTDVATLCDLLELDSSQLETLIPDAKNFPLHIPRPFLRRIKAGDPHDPLLRQVLPLAIEQQSADGFIVDPLAENAFIKNKGLIQKYQGRALLVLTGFCPINCRYCFRRHFPYQSHRLSKTDIRNALEILNQDDSIEEIILSGGEPLVVSDPQLQWLFTCIEEIPHIKRLRIHTRMPVVIPQRITAPLCRLIEKSPLQIVIVSHINHSNEIDQQVINAYRKLQASHALLLNQSVMLKGVNDSVAALAELSRALLTAGIMPYYLHQLDAVAGAHHFQVDQEKVTQLINQLRNSQSGYMVPKLVQEIPGQPSKTPIDSIRLIADEDDSPC